MCDIHTEAVEVFCGLHLMVKKKSICNSFPKFAINHLFKLMFFKVRVFWLCF